MIVDQASPRESAGAASAPGQVITAGDGQLLVATGDGVLSLDRVQPAGKRVMSADEFLRGYRVSAGDRLGR